MVTFVIKNTQQFNDINQFLNFSKKKSSEKMLLYSNKLGYLKIEKIIMFLIH